MFEERYKFIFKINKTPSYLLHFVYRHPSPEIRGRNEDRVKKGKMIHITTCFSN
jgi:hypothetical protein